MAEKGKAAFPLGCDMGEKLRELESRRLYFSRMAGTAEKRRTYPYCQESKLVCIVLEHVNKQEYGECLKRVLEKVKVKKLVQNLMDGGNAEDEDTPIIMIAVSAMTGCHLGRCLRQRCWMNGQ